MINDPLIHSDIDERKYIIICDKLQT